MIRRYIICETATSTTGAYSPSSTGPTSPEAQSSFLSIFTEIVS